MKILSFYLTIFIIFLASQNKLFSQDQKGIIKGSVIEFKSGEKFQGANIFVINTEFNVYSDSNGTYQICGLDTGLYKLECRFMGYKPIIITDVHVKENKPVEITFLLTPITLDKDFIILSSNVPKKIPNQNTYNIDPHFIFNYDKTIDPDMIIAVDPSIDLGMIINPIDPKITIKSINDSLKIMILDSLKRNSKLIK